MKLARQIVAALQMVKDVGISTTAARIRNFGYARLNSSYRSRQFRRLKLQGTVIREILGSRMRLDADQGGLDRDLLLDGIREPIATGHILAMIQSDDVVLEVGANIGYYALLEAKHCEKIYAVEPHPDNFRRLVDNLELNSITNTEPFNLAFGASSGKIPMHCSELSNWHSCKNVHSGEKNVIDVECLTIDDFVADRTQPTFIKMDVEGYELEVLRGGIETLKSVRCVFLELHGDILSAVEIREVLDILREAGLQASLIAQYDRPGMARTYPLSQMENIYAGDRGTFELFFSRDAQVPDPD